jgi:probable addiction module antidote protein
MENMENFAKFEVADYLDSEEVIAKYFRAALEDENPDVFVTAVADIAKARGRREKKRQVSIDGLPGGLLP